MKFIYIAFIMLFITGCGDGFITTTTTNELKTPDANYELDTWGSNSEVYEFTPQTAPNKTCIVFMLDNLKSMSMQCFDK